MTWMSLTCMSPQPHDMTRIRTRRGQDAGGAPARARRQARAKIKVAGTLKSQFQPPCLNRPKLPFCEFALRQERQRRALAAAELGGVGGIDVAVRVGIEDRAV